MIIKIIRPQADLKAGRAGAPLRNFLQWIAYLATSRLSGTAILLRIPTVIVGENRTFMGPTLLEASLQPGRSRSVQSST